MANGNTGFNAKPRATVKWCNAAESTPSIHEDTVGHRLPVQAGPA